MHKLNIQITSGDIFLLMFWLAFTYIIWMPPTWLLMRFITPKTLVDRYFKKPHFTSAELALFSHFPGSLMRAGILMNLCVWPHKGKKRQILEIRNDVPHWYVIASKCFVFFALGQGLLAIFLLIGLIIYTSIFNN